MTSWKNYLLVTLIIFIHLPESFSQEFFRGYIFSRKGDTIGGFIQLPPANRASGVCVFKPTLRDNPVIMNPKDISGFGAGNTIYISTLIQLPQADTLIFTRLMYDGRYDLMYFETSETKHFIVLRPDSTVYGMRYPPELKPADILNGMTAERKWKNQTDSIFTDFPDLPEYKKGIKPEINSFVNLFRQYHNNPSSSLTRRLPAAEEDHSQRKIKINNKNTESYIRDFKIGYIVNNNGDTINGLIGNRLKNSLFMSCFFSPQKNEPIVRFNPGDIAGFGNYKENKIFVASSIPSYPRDTSAFVRLLFDGKVDLLFYEASAKKHYLFRDEDNKLTVISYPPALNKDDYASGLNSDRKFELQADSIFARLGFNAAPRIKPDPRSFIKIIEKNHLKKAEPYKIYNGKERVFDLGFVAGIRFEKYKYDQPYDDYKSYSEPAIFSGISAKFYNKRSGSGVLVRNIFGYHNHHYTYLVKNPGSWTYVDASIRGLSNNTEAGFFISPFPRTFLKPSVEGGPVMAFYLKPEYSHYIDQVMQENNNVLSFYFKGTGRTPFYFGLFARMGISVDLRNGNYIKVAGGYNYLSAQSEQIHAADISASYMIRYRQK